MTRKSLIPKSWEFEPQSLGEHIRKKRLELGLEGKEAAKHLGASPNTILNWELGHSSPMSRFIPKIISFLGYNPLPQPEDQTLAKLLRVRRRELGLNHKEAALVMGVSPDSVLYWEREEKSPQVHFRPNIISFLEYNPFQAVSQTIPGILKAKRHELGLSQKEAGRRLGVKADTWARWELGHPVRKRKDQRAIARILGISEEEVRATVGERR